MLDADGDKSGVPSGFFFRGFVHVSSDETGSHPATNPVTPDDVAATVYYLMGIAPRSEGMNAQGRPIMISSGNPIMEVVA